MTGCEKEYVNARQVTDDNIIRRMHLSRRIPTATDTHSEYIFIAFPLQQWLPERTSMLSYTYIALLLFRKKRQIM